jgi:hypothetical protein
LKSNRKTDAVKSPAARKRGRDWRKKRIEGRPAKNTMMIRHKPMGGASQESVMADTEAKKPHKNMIVWDLFSSPACHNSISKIRMGRAIT